MITIKEKTCTTIYNYDSSNMNINNCSVSNINNSSNKLIDRNNSIINISSRIKDDVILNFHNIFYYFMVLSLVIVVPKTYLLLATRH